MHCISVFIPKALPDDFDAEVIMARARESGRYPELDLSPELDGYLALHFFTDAPEPAWESLKDKLFATDEIGAWLKGNVFAQLHHEDGDDEPQVLYGSI